MTTNIVTGFNSMKRQDAVRQASGAGGGNYIRYVTLKDDGDMVLFRMVTDSDAEFAKQSGVPHVFIKGEFHSVQGTSTRGKDFWRDVLCESHFDEEKEQWVGKCENCENQTRRRTQFFSWVYVYAFYFRAQDVRYVPGDNQTDKFKRKQVRRGKNDIFYKEEVNKYCLWQDGYYMLELLKTKIGQFGTLCDRDYEVIRHGVRRSQQTQRELIAHDPVPMPEEIKEGALELPTLADVANGKTRTYNTSTTQAVPEEVDLADIPEDTMPMVEGFEAPAESEVLYEELGAAVADIPSDDDFEAIFNEGPGVNDLTFGDEGEEEKTDG